ncbi:MAG: methyltransferase domain-containing protein [Anaerolineales bacterium]|nr:methyltransferase domain-containing protein [Anaerolineales bacterium]
MDWHKRYLQQADWTRPLRAYLFEQAGIKTAQRILEVGCGTGAVLASIESPASLHGLDIEPASLSECRLHAPSASLTCGDGLALPYTDHSFDIVYCHFFLLWTRAPLQAVLEMKRVTRRGGHILALAEPDYAARVDKPDELKILGERQAESLKRQGADPGFGARLAEVFFQAGIKLHETGPIQTVRKEPSAEELEIEWEVIRSDLAGTVDEAEIQKLKSLDALARRRGERVLHVPTYFAWGQT